MLKAASKKHVLTELTQLLPCILSGQFMIIIRLKNDLIHRVLLTNIRKLLNLRTLLHLYK